MKKSTYLLLALAVLLGTYIWFHERHADTSAERRADARRAFRFRPEDIREVGISHAGLDLLCVRADGTWQLVEPVRDRASAPLVERFLHYLELLRKTTSITPDERERHGVTLADYGLANPVARIALKGPGFARTYEIGDLARLGQTVYIREEDGENIFPVDYRLVQLIPDTAAEWRAQELFTDDLSSLTRFAVRRKDGFFQLARENGDTWMIQQPFKARASRLAVQDFLARLEGLAISDFIADEIGDPAAYGLEQNFTELILWSGLDTPPRNLLVGQPALEPPGCVYAKWGDKDSVYAVSNSLLTTLGVPLNALRDRRLTALFAPSVRQVILTQGEMEIELQRTPDQTWQLVRPYRQNADALRVEHLVESWTESPVRHFIADHSTNLAAYGLQPPRARLFLSTEILTNGAEAARTEDLRPTAASLLISTLPPEQDRLLVADVNGSVFSIDAAALERFSLNPLFYRDRQLLGIPRENILRIALARGDREEIIARETSREPFRVVSAAAGQTDNMAIEALLRSFAAMQVERYVVENPQDPSLFGLVPPRASITLGLTGAEGIASTLIIGEPTDRQTHYAMLRGRDTVFELDNALVNILTNGLLRVPAAP